MTRLSVVILLLSATFSNAQSATPAACVSSPGVDLRLLTACEQLQTQLSKQLTAGGTVDLSTQITYQVTPTTDGGNGGSANAPSTAVLTTSAVATTPSSAGLGGVGGASGSGGSQSNQGQFGNSQVPSSSGAAGGFGTSNAGGSSTAAAGFGGSGGSNAPPKASSAGNGDGFPSGAASTSSGALGFPGVASTDMSQSASGANGQPTSNADGATTGANGAGGVGTMSTMTSAPGSAGAQNTNAPGLTQSSSNSDPNHYRNTVVIPVAVVCTVVPLLLLALLACCLLRRRRNKKNRDSALLAGAGNEKYHGHTEDDAAANAALGGVGKKATSANRNPFTNAAAINEGSGVHNAAATGAPAQAPSGGGHHGMTDPEAAGLGASAMAGAGAAGWAAHHYHESNQRSPQAAGGSVTPSMTSAYSQQNNFHGFSGAGTPIHSSPGSSMNQMQQLTPAQHGSNLAPAAGLGLGAGALGAGAAASRHHNRNQPAGTMSTVRSDRPPTLPEMDPSIGSGTWLSGDYDDPTNRGSIPTDPAALAMDGHHSGNDYGYGVPREDLSDHYGSGVRQGQQRASTNYSRPSVPSSPLHNQMAAGGVPEVPEHDPAGAGDLHDDPFVTPTHSARQSAEQFNPPPPPPMIPQRSHERTPPITQHAFDRPSSPTEKGNKANQVLGIGEASGSARASPVPRHQQSMEEMMAQPGPSSSANPDRSGPLNSHERFSHDSWAPPAVGEVREGPYMGGGYTSPTIGLDNDRNNGSGLEQHMQQVTSYPTEDEARLFDFQSARSSGEHMRTQEGRRFSVPRKPVGR